MARALTSNHRSTNALLRNLESLGIAGAALDRARRIVAANECLTDMLGVPHACLQGADIAQLLTSASSRVAHFDASAVYFFDRHFATRGYRLDLKAAGDILLGILTDVGAEHHALEELRHSYATRDRLLFDGKIGTWRFDPDAEVYYFSSELALGHEQATAPVPISLLRVIQHPDDRDKDTAIRERITREGGTAEAEMRYRGADGSWTHLQVHYRAGRRTPSGRYEMFGISQDITPVAIARDAANQVSRRLTLALQAAQAGVFEYDYEKSAFWISPELTELIGEEALGTLNDDPFMLFVPKDRDHLRAFLNDAESGGRAGSVDLRIVQPRGHRWVRFYFDVKKRDANGRPLVGIGLLIDIEERKRQEIALAEAQRTAEFANRTKTEFLANMSHELRTPLNAILGFSEMIATKVFGPINAKYAEYAWDIHRSGNHLLELVNDVLDLAKLEAGKLELRESEIHVPTLVDECLILVRNRAEAGGVALETEIAAELPLLRADARSVKQVLLNFLSNAVKFTPEGGSVTIRAACDPRGGVHIAVGDTGIGMSAAEIEVAMSPFGQIDSTLARKHQGTGLGLPICKSLMELHGGDIVAASKPREGTTLTARFPAARTIRPAVASASAS